MPLYHVWFSTKRRKWLLQGDVAEAAERAIWEAARSHGIRLHECKSAVDHVHVMIGLESPEELPAAMKALKGRSARAVFQELETLKLDGQTDNLWQRGYGWKPVAPGTERTVRRYIRTQMERLDKFDR